MNIDLTEIERAETCGCCRAAASTLRDGDLGPVCAECFCLLLTVGQRLKSQAQRESAVRQLGARVAREGEA